MSKVLEMAEAHLLNVEREINMLRERQKTVEAEIEKLTLYLREGVAQLQQERQKLSEPDPTASLADPNREKEPQDLPW
jgi:predicted  nucleic acid-binding Zn-ribbon protein